VYFSVSTPPIEIVSIFRLPRLMRKGMKGLIMDRFIQTITGTISNFVGKQCQGNVVVGLAILPECLRLHARSLRMRLYGATCEGMYSAGISGTKPSLDTATTWQQPGRTCRRVSPDSWRSARRQWFDGARASA
jgi:hypothetical protein